MKNSGFSSQPVSVCHAAAWVEVGGCLRSFGAPFCNVGVRVVVV